MNGQRRETEFDERDRTENESERAENCISSARRNARDVISTLPDSLLCHILSFLPTPDAIRTSILSSRWRPLWTLVPILYFNHQDIPQITHPLEDIVSSIFTLRNAGPDPAPIHKLRIFLFKCCVPTHLETWVAASIRLCLQELELNLQFSKTSELPCSIFFSTTLAVLKLNGDILLNPPPSYFKGPLTVPECLSSHLTTFHYNQFSGDGVEMEFVRQLLMVAGVLKTMRITVTSTLDSEVKLQVHEKLSEYQRSSQSCQIAFD